MSQETGLAAIIPPDKTSTASLSGKMGVFDVIFTVVAYNGPAVVFIGALPVAMLIGNQLGTPVMLLAAGVLVGLVASGLVNISNHMARPGGFYSIVSVGLGKISGMAIGFTAILTYFTALLSVYVIGGIGLSGLIADIPGAPSLPWWVTGGLMLIAVTVLGHRNIQFSARVLYIFLSLEFALIAIYIVCVLVQGGAHGIGFESFFPKNVFSGNMLIGLVFCIMLFGGFEATVIFREEVHDPERTIKRATYGTAAIIAITYSLLTWVFINAYGANTVMAVLNKDAGSAAQESVRHYVGEWAYVAVSILLVTSSFALALASHNILTRYVYNFAMDGILHKGLAKIHPKHKSPYRASLIVSAAAVVAMIGLVVSPIPEGQLYGMVAAFISYGMVIMLAVVSAAIGVFMLRRNTSRTIHAIIMFVVSAVLFVCVFVVTVQFSALTGITGAGAVIIPVCFWIFILLGGVLAYWAKKKRPDIYAKIGRDEG